MFYGHFRAHRGRLNGPSDLQQYWSEVKDETTFRCAHAEIRTRLVVDLWSNTLPLDHEGAPHLYKTLSLNEVLELIGFLYKSIRRLAAVGATNRDRFERELLPGRRVMVIII